jgi:hypothetical protein
MLKKSIKRSFYIAIDADKTILPRPRFLLKQVKRL